MKPVTILLTASTVVFAATTAWLGHELSAARASADDAARLASLLGARVTELQRTRTSPPGMPVPGAAGAATAAPLPAPAGAAADASGFSAEEERAMAEDVRNAFAVRMQSPATQRAFKAQLRTGAKRMYADFAAENGLTPAEASALYDFIAQQQVDPSMNPGADAQAREAKWQRDLVGLLGEERAQRLREYQHTFEARGQISQLEEQLEGADLPLSPDQRRRLVKAALQDAQQFPTPAFGTDQSPEQMMQAYGDWQRDRAERLAAAARAILDARQMQHFEDLREMQHELSGPGN